MSGIDEFFLNGDKKTIWEKSTVEFRNSKYKKNEYAFELLVLMK